MRVKPKIPYYEKQNLSILMDERVDVVDERTIRVIFSVVELLGDEDISEHKKIFKSLRDKYNKKVKFHFTDINDGDVRDAIVNEVAELPIMVKEYIYYAFDSSELEAKNCALKWAIRSTQKNLSKRFRLKFFVEDATQYRKIIRKENLVSEDTLTIIPDVFCYIFAMRLDATKRQYIKNSLTKNGLLEEDKYDELFNIHWFNKLSNKICLEVYWVGDKVVSHKSKRQLLPPIVKK